VVELGPLLRAGRRHGTLKIIPFKSAGVCARLLLARLRGLS
jgi:hypothetical protein